MSITTKIKIGPDSEYDAFEYEDAALKDTERQQSICEHNEQIVVVVDLLQIYVPIRK